MMAIDHRRRGLMLHTSVVWLLYISVLLLASTPRVRSQNVRLAGSSLPNEGRLEIFHQYQFGLLILERWGTVCDDLFDYIDAGVVCNSLGRGYGYKGTVIGNLYGPGTGPILLDDVRCIGNETSIANCSHAGWGVHNCKHSEDVSVSCGRSSVQRGPLPNADNFFIVADAYLRNIYQVDATSGVTAQLLPFNKVSEPSALAYDSTAKLLYWADLPACTINRYNPLTHSSTVIYRDPSNNALYWGLAIDTRRRKLYYADAQNNFGNVGELSTDGSHPRVLIRVTNSRPHAVVFDEDNRMLYWTDSSATSPGIYRSSVVNSARETLFSTDLVMPLALAIDFKAGVMYWGDAYLRKIEMANIDGSGRKSLVTERTGQYFGFTVHAGNIYFTDWKIAYIRRLNISAGSVDVQSSATRFQQLNGIVFVPDRSKIVESEKEPKTHWSVTQKSSTTQTTVTDTTTTFAIAVCVIVGIVVIVIVVGVVIVVYRCTRRKHQRASPASQVWHVSETPPSAPTPPPQEEEEEEHEQPAVTVVNPVCDDTDFDNEMSVICFKPVANVMLYLEK